MWTESDVRTWVRNPKTGIIYYIVPGGDGKWKTSGQTSVEVAKKKALAEANGEIIEYPLLKDFANDFYIPEKCLYVATKEDGDAGKRTAKHWRVMRQMVDNYLIPKWGNTPMNAVYADQFHEWVLKLKGLRKGERLSSSTRVRIRTAAINIWDWAVFKRRIQFNPLLSTPKIALKNAKRRKFNQDEINKIFPENLGSVWLDGHNIKSVLQNPWAVAAMLDAEGLRPQETLALYWEDYRPERKAFIVHRAINEEGMGGLKTSDHGVKKRAVKVSDRLAEILSIGAGMTGLIFTQADGSFLRVDTFGKIFCKTLDRIEGFDRDGRTLYCLRHTKNTSAVTEALKSVQATLGHTTDTMTANYDDPDEEDLFGRIGR